MNFGWMFFLFIFICISMFFVSMHCGIGGWGPTSTVDAKVLKTYVDVSKDDEGGSTSHYMVITDKGSFEIDNGFLLGMWNADDMFGKIQEGKTYRFTTKGRRYQNMFMQEMPYITHVDSI